jgi:hypothetical protein
MVRCKRCDRSREPMMGIQRSAAVLVACCVLAGRAVADEASSSGWRLEFEASPAPASLTLKLRARQDVRGWMSSGRPVLTIQCSGGKAAVYVEAAVALEVTQVDQQIVRVRFDDAGFLSEHWREVGNATISSRHPVRLIGQLLRSRGFSLEFTPFGGAPSQVDFAVQGLAEYLQRLAMACGVRGQADHAFREDVE